MEEKLTLIIGADLVPTESNLEYFRNADLEGLMGAELLDTVNSADVRVFNIETPLTDSSESIIKSGPCIKASPLSVSGIKAMKPDVLALANNHVRDYSGAGVSDTLRILEENGIGYIGAGKSISEARKTALLSVGGKKVAVCAFAEHEFSIAKTDRNGANPYDPLTSFDDVRAAAKDADYTVVLYHGGKEYYPYPTPYQQRVCRKFVEVGADLVVCQHSHCVGASEQYEGKWIVYGQGNFIFDFCEDECFQTGILVKANLLSPESEPEYIPFVKQKNLVRIAGDEDKEKILDGMKERSAEIKKTGFVEEKFAEKSAAEANYYLRKLHGAGFKYKVADKLTKNLLTRSNYNSDSKIAELINCLECETHREVIINYLHNRLGI